MGILSKKTSTRAEVLTVLISLAALAVAWFNAASYPPDLDWTSGQHFSLAAMVLLMIVTELMTFKVSASAVRSTFFLATLTASVLLLPGPWVMAAVAVSLLVAGTIRYAFNLGKPQKPVKTIYESASEILGAGVMVFFYHSVIGEMFVRPFTPELLSTDMLFVSVSAAVCYSLIVFGTMAVYNLLVEGEKVSSFIDNNTRAFLTTTVGSSCLGLLVVVVLAVMPILLPITVIPAWAVYRAIRDSGTQERTQQRAHQVQELAQLLNSNPSQEEKLIESFLGLAQDSQEADSSAVVYTHGGELQLMVADEEGVSLREMEEQLAELYHLQKEKPELVHFSNNQLPAPWRSALVSPLEVDGEFKGVALLGSKGPSLALTLPLWGSLASSLSAALTRNALFARIEAITASQGEAVIALNLDGSVNFSNPAAQALFDGELEKAGELQAEIKTFEETLTLKEIAKRLDSTPMRYDNVILSRNNKETAVTVTVSPLRLKTDTDGTNGAVLVFQDLTAQKAAAKALAKSQEQILALGRALQVSLLPPALPKIEGVDVDVRYHAAEGGLDIGGDFYDLLNTKDGHYNIIMGDVCGRGPEAAALTSLTRHTLRGAVGTDPDPVSALKQLNEAVYALDGDMFCTVTMGRLSVPVDGRAILRVVSGGHPPVLVVRKNGEVEEINPYGPLIGVIENIRLDVETVELNSGDSVIFYTDGVLEARGPDGAFFEDEGLKATLSQYRGESAKVFTEALDDKLRKFQGGILHDDTAFLVLTVK